jgi:hypothetical protein
MNLQIYLITAAIELGVSAICVVLSSHQLMDCKDALRITYILIGAIFGSFVGVYLTTEVYPKRRVRRRRGGGETGDAYAFMDPLIGLLYGNLIGAGLAVSIGVLIYNSLQIPWAQPTQSCARP